MCSSHRPKGDRDLLRLADFNDVMGLLVTLGHQYAVKSGGVLHQCDGHLYGRRGAVSNNVMLFLHVFLLIPKIKIITVFLRC